METSVIIRIKNERENFEKVLQILKDQNYQDFEVVIVDDNSQDGSDRVALKYFVKQRIKLVRVPKGKFTYPYASNLGANASSGRYLVYLSAHSYPVSNTWLSDGLKNFDDPKVAGVFAYPLAHQDTNIIEKIWYSSGTKGHLPITLKLNKAKGLLGTTNAIIRNDLWKRYNFNEKFKIAEDDDWARHFRKLGYKIIQDSKFRVYHSHHLGLLGLIKQSYEWGQTRSGDN